MKRIVLLNPNTSEATTAVMVEIAREVAPAGLHVAGMTARFGAPLITNEEELDVAARAVCALAPELAHSADAVIVSAFADPAVEALSNMLGRPVVGIAEAGMRAAARGGRRFAVVTTPARLIQHMAARAEEIGLGALCAGVLATPGDAAELMARPDDLERALHALANRAVAELCAEAVVIGGGPLGRVAVALRDRLSVPVIEPIPEAVRHIAAALGAPATR